MPYPPPSSPDRDHDDHNPKPPPRALDAPFNNHRPSQTSSMPHNNDELFKFDDADDYNSNNNNNTKKDMKKKKGNTKKKHKKSDGVKHRYKDAEFHWKHFFTKKTWIPYWIAIVVLAIIVILMTVYHDSIIEWLRPVSNRIRALSWGWLIPILVLIALSFPPLFGHEIVIILCGIIWHLWVGFGIAAAGTFFGEVITYICFRTCLHNRAVRAESTSLNYASLARLTRQGGFLIVFIVRLSVIPSHFTTAVFAVCGVKFWIFAVASFITLPKQLIIVYLGVLFDEPKKGGVGRRVSNITLGVTFVITVACGWYIWVGMLRARRELIKEAEEEWAEERRKSVANKGIGGGGNGGVGGGKVDVVSDAEGVDVDGRDGYGNNGYHEQHPYYEIQQKQSQENQRQQQQQQQQRSSEERVEVEAARRDLEAQNMV